MMSLTETSLTFVVKKQYYYKLKAHAGLFFSLMAAQLLALLISVSGVATSSSSSGSGLVYIRTSVSSDVLVIFTLIWAFAIGATLAGNSFRLDFTFVSNRLSSNLSSILFLLTAAALGGLTASLGGILLRVAMYFIESGIITGAGFWIAPQTLLGGILIASLYMLMLCSLGYFVGMLAQRNVAYVGLLFGIFFGILFLELRTSGQAALFLNSIGFFTKESSYLLFTLKAVMASALIFGTVIFFSNRLEVRP
jgi:hypothetical protein